MRKHFDGLWTSNVKNYLNSDTVLVELISVIVVKYDGII